MLPEIYPSLRNVSSFLSTQKTSGISAIIKEFNSICTIYFEISQEREGEGEGFLTILRRVD
jgi:hypothetical protein